MANSELGLIAIGFASDVPLIRLYHLVIIIRMDERAVLSFPGRQLLPAEAGQLIPRITANPFIGWDAPVEHTAADRVERE